MKKPVRYLFLVAMGFATLAAAELPVPELCWTDSPSIAKGAFVVSVKTGDLSKDELLGRLHDLGGDLYLQPQRFPYVSQDLDFLSVNLKAMNQERNETNEAFMQRINEKIRRYQVLPGFRVSCSMKAIPHPSTTGSN